MTKEEQRARSDLIFFMRVYGCTYRMIGDYFGKSVERMRQVCAKEVRIRWGQRRRKQEITHA